MSREPYRLLPGQESDAEAASHWPSSNTGWRLAVAVGAAGILLALVVVVIGVNL